MARPERNDVDYFPHEVGSGKKMYYIETKYGNDWYAVRYKLLEELWRAEYHYLDLSKFENVMFLSAKCKVDETTLLNIIGDLTKMDVFDQQLMQVKIVWCQKFVDSIQDAYSRRKNDCVDRESLLQHIRVNVPHKPSKCSTETQEEPQKPDNKPQSKVEETIQEKTTVDSIVESMQDETSSSELSTGDPDKNLPAVPWPDQEEIERRKSVAKRNQRLVDWIKETLQSHWLAYKKHPQSEKYRANLFFKAKDFLAIVAWYGATPWIFAIKLCDEACKHKYWSGRITNTVDLYDNRAKIHNDCMAVFKKKTWWRKGL